jgi:hypothetical protein
VAGFGPYNRPPPRGIKGSFEDAGNPRFCGFFSSLLVRLLHALAAIPECH